MADSESSNLSVNTVLGRNPRRLFTRGNKEIDQAREAMVEDPKSWGACRRTLTAQAA